MNYIGQCTCSAVFSKAYHSHIYYYSSCFTHFSNLLEHRRQLSYLPIEKMVVKVNASQLCLTLCDLDSVAQSMEFSRPEYWGG